MVVFRQVEFSKLNGCFCLKGESTFPWRAFSLFGEDRVTRQQIRTDKT